MSVANDIARVDHPALTLSWEVIVLATVKIMTECAIAGQRRALLEGGATTLPGKA